jgi:hypothetical protein
MLRVYTKNIFMRYTVALLLTVCVYNFAYIPENNYFYVVASCWCLGYVVALSRFRTRTTWMLAFIESIALFFILSSSVERNLSPESQWFNNHYADIMSYCYLSELAVIIIGGTCSGLSAINRLWVDVHNFFKSMRRNFYIGQMAL